MTITYTNIKPTFPPNSFDSEKEHVKQISASLTAGSAFASPIATELAAVVTRIDELTAQLESDANTATAELGDTTTEDTLLFFGDASANLPDSWTAATPPLVEADMLTISDVIPAYITANELIRTNLATLKTFINTVDINNFKLHHDLLSGLREDPPQGIVKASQRSVMGLVTAIQTLENKNGIAFTNYFPPLFGVLFTGDITIANAQTFLDTNPIPTTYASLDIVTRVQVDPFIEVPADIAAEISGLISGTTYATTVLTHKDNFNTHITDDTAQYNIVVDKLDRAVQALNISSHISDDYTKFMYTNVFGSAAIKEIITKKDNGTIT